MPRLLDHTHPRHPEPPRCSINSVASQCGSWRPSPWPGAAPKHAAAPGAVASGAPQAERTDEEKVLNVYNWSDYIAPEVVPNFEKEYGIKVHYDVFDSNEVLQTKLLAGQTGYDIVVPTANFLALQIKAGVFRKLDKSLLPNLKNVDPGDGQVLRCTGSGHAICRELLLGHLGCRLQRRQDQSGDARRPGRQLSHVLRPDAWSRHFKDCGVTLLDAPDEVINTVFVYLGITPNSEKPEDLAAAEKTLMAIRPYVRYINSSKYIEDLANGEICLALGWSGDVGQAALRAREAKNGNNIKYLIPEGRRGAVL